MNRVAFAGARRDQQWRIMGVVMRTYRVGFIGCGGISRAHADGYKHVRNAQIEFVAGSDIDPDGEKARRLADEYGVKLTREGFRKRPGCYTPYGYLQPAWLKTLISHGILGSKKDAIVAGKQKIHREY